MGRKMAGSRFVSGLGIHVDYFGNLILRENLTRQPAASTPCIFIPLSLNGLSAYSPLFYRRFDRDLDFKKRHPIDK